MNVRFMQLEWMIMQFSSVPSALNCGALLDYVWRSIIEKNLNGAVFLLAVIVLATILRSRESL